MQALFRSPGLGRPRGLALSDDGRYIYVVGGADNAVGVFARDPESGTFVQVEVVKDGVGGVEGLGGAKWIARSPDDRYAYVAAASDDAVVVFARDAETGTLTFIEQEKDGVGGVSGLDNASWVSLSPDGAHLYVASINDDAVAVFRRDPETGTLAFIERKTDGVAGVDGLHGARSLAVSPDGAHVYVTSLYEDVVAIFGRNPADGRLTFLGTESEGVFGVAAVSVSGDGSQVYVVGSGNDPFGDVTGSLAVYNRDAGTGLLTVSQVLKDGVDGVDGLAGAWSISSSPDGRHLYCAAYKDDSIATFRRDEETGQVAFAGLVRDGVSGVEGLDSVENAVVSPDGRHVYAVSTIDQALTVFARDAATGDLAFVDALARDAGGLDGAAAVAVSPDGAQVCVAGSVDNAVAVFDRDPTNGLLFFRDDATDGLGVDGLDGATALTVSPDGAHLYAAGADDDALAAFAFTTGINALRYLGVQRDGVGGIDGLAGASSVAVSPDGAHVYAAGYDDGAIAVFARDPASGALNFLATERNGGGGVEGLGGASAVTTSPDGAQVYATGFADNALAFFQRHPTTGLLTFDGVLREGAGGVDGLRGPRGLACSPDGRHLYVAASADDAIALFSRDPESGTPTFVAAYRDGVAGVDGLDGADAVAVSPDGAFVYATGYDDDALAVFARAAESGALSFVEVHRRGLFGVQALDGPRAVAVSADGLNVYAASSVDGAVQVFARRTPTPSPSATPTRTATRTPTVPFVPGDVTGDGTVDEEDVSALVGALFNPAPPPAADVNDDGRISAADLVALRSLLQ
ncbi:MAG TPA: beta-propeller fold lactonase family protein [Candidatus Dormibacteraeota bacterium]|nr:beta-propeller fold lactonase family protein [Candidatus Dormibacteraeota bacterium]